MSIKEQIRKVLMNERGVTCFTRDKELLKVALNRIEELEKELDNKSKKQSKGRRSWLDQF